MNEELKDEAAREAINGAHYIGKDKTEVVIQVPKIELDRFVASYIDKAYELGRQDMWRRNG